MTRSPPIAAGSRPTASRPAELDAIEAETRAAVAEAEAEARAAPEPSADVLETQVWTDGGSSWRN